MTDHSTTQTVMHADADEVSALYLLATLVERWRLLLLGPMVCGLIAFGISTLIPSTYTAVTKFLPPQQLQSAALGTLQSLGAMGGLAGAAAGLKNPGDQYVTFLTSRTVQGAIVDKFKLQSRYKAELRSDALSVLKSNVRISNGKDGLITVEVDDTDPVFAAQLANAYVQELGVLLDRLAITEAQQRRNFFAKQLAQTKDNLARAEIALKATGVSEAALKASPATAVSGVAQLQAAISAQEVKIESMRGYLTESAPEFKQAQSELRAMRSQRARIASSDTHEGDAGTADYTTRYRDVKYQETLFELFAKQLELAKVDESREGATIQVLDSAVPPDRKSKPKRAILALVTAALVEALLLAYVFVQRAFALEANTSSGATQLARIRRVLG